MGRGRFNHKLAIVIPLIVVMPLAGCGDSDTTRDEKITLTIDVFASQGFGYEDLYEEYMRTHPNIEITERRLDSLDNSYITTLSERLEAGEGAGDIVALEENAIPKYLDQADYFVNLLEYGAGALEGNYLSWKWQEGMTADGTRLVGLGTDVGSIAICYRSDLFEEAGLPTDREAVTALWPTWEEFIEVGERFLASGTGKDFLDGPTSTFRIILTQLASANSGYTFFDTNNRFDMEGNPDVKAAWDLTIRIIDRELTPVGTSALLNDEDAAFQNATFATIACPAWMTGIIMSKSGDSGAGNWDVAGAPGGGANWGGSFLTIPAQGEHPQEAYELITYLTSAEGQIAAWNSLGNVPSNPHALDDGLILSAQSDYFSGAPVGQIYAAGATDLKPVYFGPENEEILTVLNEALSAVAEGQLSAEQAWWEAVGNATAIAAQSAG